MIERRPIHRYYWEVLTPDGRDSKLIIEIEPEDNDNHHKIYYSKIMSFVAELGLHGWECKQDPRHAFQKINANKFYSLFFQRIKIDQDNRRQWEYGYISYNRIEPPKLTPKKFVGEPGIYELHNENGKLEGERPYDPTREWVQDQFNVLLEWGFTFRWIKPLEK